MDIFVYTAMFSSIGFHALDEAKSGIPESTLNLQSPINMQKFSI